MEQIYIDPEQNYDDDTNGLDVCDNCGEVVRLALQGTDAFSEFIDICGCN